MHLSRHQSSIKKIKAKAKNVLESVSSNDMSINAEEVKVHMSEIIDLANECLSTTYSVEFGLLELLRKVRS